MVSPAAAVMVKVWAVLPEKVTVCVAVLPFE